MLETVVCEAHKAFVERQATLVLVALVETRVSRALVEFPVNQACVDFLVLWERLDLRDLWASVVHVVCLVSVV